MSGLRRRVVTIGETMALLRTREIGSLTHAHDLVIGIGGAESNVAIGLRRLGIGSGWLGRVGNDPLGERVVREIRAEGVDVTGIVDDGASTGLMLKERPISRTTAVHYYRSGSAGSRLAPADIPDGWVEQAELLHVSGITALLSASARECVSVAVDRARAAGVPVSFDVNYRSALDGAGAAAAVLRGFAERADVVFGGAEELERIAPAAGTARAAAREVAGAGDRVVVLKRGAEGATAFLPDGEIDSPAFPVDLVDTVGAGDAFVAGYLSGLLEGLDVVDRLRRANACGAMLCMTPGDWESSPRLADLAGLLEPGRDPVSR